MNKEFIFLIIKDKVINSKNRKVNINLKSTNRMDCMFIFKYKHTIALNDLCLDQNRLIENFLFNKMQEIEKYLFQSYVIKINLINPKIIFNNLYKLSKIVFRFKEINFVCNRMINLLKLIKQFSLDSKIVFNKLKDLLKEQMELDSLISLC